MHRRLHQIVAEGAEAGPHPAVAVAQAQLPLDDEADQPLERDQIAPVLGFAERDDPPRAARPVDVGFAAAGPLMGQDHPDQPLRRRERRHRHVQIARLENIERQPAVRQQERAAERKNRNLVRQILEFGIERTRHQENRIADSLRRPATVTGSVGPSASNSSSSCFRAA